jgi:hypothetical protein
MIGGIVFWLAAATTGTQTIACRPFPPLHDETIAACAAQRADGSFRVLPSALRALEFDQGELAVATIDGQLHYIHRSGRTAPVLRFDNGADYFVEGVARTVREGKVGFIDRRLALQWPDTIAAPAHFRPTPFCGTRPTLWSRSRPYIPRDPDLHRCGSATESPEE